MVELVVSWICWLLMGGFVIVNWWQVVCNWCNIHYKFWWFGWVAGWLGRWWWAWPVVIYRQKEKEKEKYNYRNRKKYPNRFIDFFSFLFFLEGGWSTKKNCFENKFINYYIILFWEKNKNKTGGRTGLQLLKIIEKLQPMGMQRSLSRAE